MARFGGDEFVILMRGLQNEGVAVEIGNRVLKSLAEPFHLGENTVPSGGSIGIAFSREDFADCDDLLRFGDLAMYRAKALRNGQVQVFEKGMLDHSQEQEALQAELGVALERGQMVMHYQPFVVIGTGAVAGIEALIRWERSPGKLLYPGDFLPLAEKAGYIQAIGEWALRTACAQNAAWQRAGLPPVRIAVNLSASQLQKKELPERVFQILRETGLDPRWLELEVTEAALMASLSAASATLKSLSDSGVRTSIDHFGSGNSSLLYLRQYNFQTVKMDRSFLSGVTSDSRAAAVAKGLITLAHSLGLCVVAEGVESDEQLQFLAVEGCEHAQGYLTGRPATGGEMGARLRSWQKKVAPSPTPKAVEHDLARLSAAHLPAASPGTGAVRWALERNARV